MIIQKLAVRGMDRGVAENQDRAELQDALSLPASHLLLAQGDRRPGHAVHGPHPDPAV